MVDGFRGVDVDTSNTMYTVMSLMWSTTGPASPAYSDACLMASVSRDLLTIQWIKEGTSTQFPNIKDCLVTTQVTPAVMYNAILYGTNILLE